VRHSAALPVLCLLSPGQVWQLRRQIDSQLAQPKKTTVKSSGEGGKRAKAAQAPNKKPSIQQLHRKMMERGLITRLPDPSLDIDDDDPDDQPVPITSVTVHTQTITRGAALSAACSADWARSSQAFVPRRARV
jgi:hypothetical protein